MPMMRVNAMRNIGGFDPEMLCCIARRTCNVWFFVCIGISVVYIYG